jgi:hypothetical protein
MTEATTTPQPKRPALELVKISFRPDLRLICMQLHATTYTQKLPPKTCARFRGPHPSWVPQQLTEGPGTETPRPFKSAIESKTEQK